MNNREKIYSFLKEYIGNGEVKVIHTPRGFDTTSFLINDIKPFLIANYDNPIIYLVDKKNSDVKFEVLDSLVSLNRKVFIMLDKLETYPFLISLIAGYYGNNNIDIICTSSLSISYLVKDRLSDIRGRYRSIFYPPHLYGDKLDKKDINNLYYLFKSIYSNYKYIEEAYSIYHFILQNIGNILSYRTIYKHVKTKLSLMTFIQVVEYLIHAGWLYKIPIMNLSTKKELTYKFKLYPTHGDHIFLDELNIDIDKRNKNYYDSLLVAKYLFNDISIFSNYFVERKFKKRNVFSNAFLIKAKYNQYLLMLKYENTNELEIQMFYNLKVGIQKVLASSNSIKKVFDSRGVLRCSLEQIFLEGAIIYERIF